MSVANQLHSQLRHAYTGIVLCVSENESACGFYPPQYLQMTAECQDQIASQIEAPAR